MTTEVITVKKPFFRYGKRDIMINGSMRGTTMLLRPYMIHYTPKSKRHSRKTFAVNFDTNGMIYVAATRCSKNDQFSRKRGSQIASGRLDKMLTTGQSSHNTTIFLNEADFMQYAGHELSVSIPSETVTYILKIRKDFLDFVSQAPSA